MLSYFLFPEFCLFFKTSYHIFLLTPEPNLNRVIIINIDALNVYTFACALTLNIRNDYTFHNAPTFGGVSSHRAESASNLIYTLNRVLVRSVVDGCRLMCVPICSPYLILNLLPKICRSMSRLSYLKHEYPVRVPTVPLYFISARPSTLSICRRISYVGLPQLRFPHLSSFTEKFHRVFCKTPPHHDCGRNALENKPQYPNSMIPFQVLFNESCPIR